MPLLDVCMAAREAAQMFYEEEQVRNQWNDHYFREQHWNQWKDPYFDLLRDLNDPQVQAQIMVRLEDTKMTGLLDGRIRLAVPIIEGNGQTFLPSSRPA
jgi:hypothetical protein